MPTITTRGAASALAYGWSRIAAVLDPYFKYVTMLLPGNGTNGAQNNTFLDSSTNNFTITRNGNATQGTFTPYGSNWSNYFNGASSLSNASNNALAFGTGAYTVECWVYYPSAPSQQAILGGTGNSPDFEVDTGKIRYMGSNDVYGTTSIAGNQWYHFVWARSGTGSNQAAAWVNGTREVLTTDTSNYAPTSLSLIHI